MSPKGLFLFRMIINYKKVEKSLKKMKSENRIIIYSYVGY